MNIIKNNPFRILGLPANSTEKEIQKNIKTLKRFAEVGKSKEFDFDFSFFGDFSRTVDTVQEASSRIEQMPQKVHNALFWFISINQIDEIAFNYLKETDFEKAYAIWNKTLKNEITAKNYSSYNNMSTLIIGLSIDDDKIDKELFKEGIKLKGKLLNSNNIKDFVSDITGNGTILEPEKLNSDFVNEILQLTKPYLENKQILPKELISYFNSFPANIKKNIISKFTDTHVYNIENEIEKTIEKRKASPRDAEEYGEELYKKTKVDISELKNLFGQNSIQFQMIADKVANEILQCSIVFFNTLREEDGEFDPGEDALKIAKYANSVGASGQVKNRIIESIETLNKIKLQDVYRAINILKSIKGAYLSIDEKYGNRIVLGGEYVDSEKVKQIIKDEISDKTVIQIAKSNSRVIIKEFYELLIFINDRIYNNPTIWNIFNLLYENLDNEDEIRLNISKIKKLLEQDEKERKIKNEEYRIKREKEEEKKETERIMQQREYEQQQEKEEQIKRTRIIIFIIFIIIGSVVGGITSDSGAGFIAGAIIGLIIGGIIARIYGFISNL